METEVADVRFKDMHLQDADAFATSDFVERFLVRAEVNQVERQMSLKYRSS